MLADPGRLRNAGITLKDVIDAVAASNGATSGGYLQLGESELVVRGRGYLQLADDIGNTVVKATNGTPVLVRNVAQVVEAYTPRRGAVARGGRDRLRRGDGAAAARGEPEGGAARRARGGRAHQPARSCRRACASCRSTTARAWSTRR